MNTLSALSSLTWDNPPLASFTMAMVKSSERGSAAGVTNIARIVPSSIKLTISTYLTQTLWLTLPLFIGGGLQLIARWLSFPGFAISGRRKNWQHFKVERRSRN